MTETVDLRLAADVTLLSEWWYRTMDECWLVCREHALKGEQVTYEVGPHECLSSCISIGLDEQNELFELTWCLIPIVCLNELSQTRSRFWLKRRVPKHVRVSAVGSSG